MSAPRDRVGLCPTLQPHAPHACRSQACSAGSDPTSVGCDCLVAWLNVGSAGGRRPSILLPLRRGYLLLVPPPPALCRDCVMHRTSRALHPTRALGPERLPPRHCCAAGAAGESVLAAVAGAGVLDARGLGLSRALAIAVRPTRPVAPAAQSHALGFPALGCTRGFLRCSPLASRPTSRCRTHTASSHVDTPRARAGKWDKSTRCRGRAPRRSSCTRATCARRSTAPSSFCPSAPAPRCSPARCSARSRGGAR